MGLARVLKNRKRQTCGAPIMFSVRYTYWSIVENRRCRGERIVQQTVLYLGEINDSQRAQWIRAIEVFDEDRGALEQIKLFAAERPLPEAAPDGVQVRLEEL